MRATERRMEEERVGRAFLGWTPLVNLAQQGRARRKAAVLCEERCYKCDTGGARNGVMEELFDDSLWMKLDLTPLSKRRVERAQDKGDCFLSALKMPERNERGEWIMRVQWLGHEGIFPMHMSWVFDIFGDHIEFLDKITDWWMTQATAEERRDFVDIEGIEMLPVRLSFVVICECEWAWGRQKLETKTTVGLSHEMCTRDKGSSIFVITKIPRFAFYWGPSGEPRCYKLMGVCYRGLSVGRHGFYVRSSELDLDLLVVPGTSFRRRAEQQQSHLQRSMRRSGIEDVVSLSASILNSVCFCSSSSRHRTRNMWTSL